MLHTRCTRIIAVVTREFVKRNPVVCRTIQIKGNQTLEDLHHVILGAFDPEAFDLRAVNQGLRKQKAAGYIRQSTARV